ncbi:unnamed protein product [Malus baccata var. baccata]
MFVAWDRLFALHNALLVESWSMKAVFFYFIWMLVIYMLTSTKQTMQRDTGFTCGPRKAKLRYATKTNGEELSWESSDDESDWSAYADKDISDGIEHLKGSNYFREEVGDNLHEDISWKVSAVAIEYNLM